MDDDDSFAAAAAAPADASTMPSAEPVLGGATASPLKAGSGGQLANAGAADRCGGSPPLFANMDVATVLIDEGTTTIVPDTIVPTDPLECSISFEDPITSTAPAILTPSLAITGTAASTNTVTNKTPEKLRMGGGCGGSSIVTPVERPKSAADRAVTPDLMNIVPINPEDFRFVPPAEAPVFTPTEAEFADPMAYINKIRPLAERSGICKIRPPTRWQPPFAVDVDKLKFTPRIQRLNELEARTRIKLNFLDQIAKFWELQGTSLRIPMVEKRALDLYTLHRVVIREGGFHSVSKERKWSRIAVMLGYQGGKGLGTILKQHYERLLFPYDVFNMEKKENDENAERNTGDDDYKPPKIKTDSERKVVLRRSRKTLSPNKPTQASNGDSKSPIKEDPDADCKDSNKELRRLQFYGAGPKMAGYNVRGAKREHDEPDPLAKYICQNCSRGDAEEQMLLCDGCDDSYHTFCLMPPVHDIPKGDWRCPRCVADEVRKPTEAFGFEQAQREYNLHQFGDMADRFKSDYFNMPVHMVPTDVVEREFWRIVSSIDEDVTVEYGADLHTMDHGSGFPTKHLSDIPPEEREYFESGWNLNNLPVLEGSVLGYINADISGMKVFPEVAKPVPTRPVPTRPERTLSDIGIPWMYVGMCFATFCWHNEDHWSYSINYLHWGEPKTWYGVPGSMAEKFEETMKSAAPELFNTQPDLLHQLVTIMNPNILMDAGVPVYRTDQHAGEFVITFPRAYHAGFNQGYNFAEAVNFAPADWIRIGRDCVTHYGQLRRFCVFSHDELVCKMALHASKLTLTIAASAYHDMLRMARREKKLRKLIHESGLTKAEREAFELLPDDERQCDVCKTTCFMSAVSCDCNSRVVVCIPHASSLCDCAPEKRTLRYRYTLDELIPMMKALKDRAESYDQWASKVRLALDRNGAPRTLTKIELETLLSKAERCFPTKDLVDRLCIAVEDAEKCSIVIRQLQRNKIRTRNSTSKRPRLTQEELRLFSEEISSLSCLLEDEKIVYDMYEKTVRFEENANRLMSMRILQCAVSEVEEWIKFGDSLGVLLPSYTLLRQRREQLLWLQEVSIYNETNVGEMEHLRALLQRGRELAAHTLVEQRLRDLQVMITTAEDWEKEAKRIVRENSDDVFLQVQCLLRRAESIPVYLPTEELIIENTFQINNWLRDLRMIDELSYYPYVFVVQEMIHRSEGFAFHVEDVSRLKEYPKAAFEWKDKTTRTFMRRRGKKPQLGVGDVADSSHMDNTTDCPPVSLMYGLSPRMFLQGLPTKAKKKLPVTTLSPSELCDNYWFERLVKDTTPLDAANLFNEAEISELASTRVLRQVNDSKLQPHSEYQSDGRVTIVYRQTGRDAVDGITAEKSSSQFCVCDKPPSGLMMRCELCRDWFHNGCVPMPRIAQVYQQLLQRLRHHHVQQQQYCDDNEAAAPMPNGVLMRNLWKGLALLTGYRKSKFLCRQCQRTRRPRLESILALLMSLQRLHTRLPEGEALQSLTIRAMQWQDRVRQHLSDDEGSAGEIGENHRILNSMLKLNTSAMARRRANNAEVKRRLDRLASGGPPDLNDSPPPFQQPPLPAAENSAGSLPFLKAAAVAATATGRSDDEEEEDDDDEQQLQLPDFSDVDKIYKLLANGKWTLPLSEHLRTTLEALQMEGDLLEVSLDESRQLWQLLLASADIDSPFIIDVDNMKPMTKICRKRRTMSGSLPANADPLSLVLSPESHGKRARGIGRRRGAQVALANITATTLALTSPRAPRGSGSRGRRGGVSSGRGRGSSRVGRRGRGRGKRSRTLGDSSTTAKDADVDDQRVGESDDGVGSDDGSTDEDPESKCAAVACQLPVGDEVDWVQCDGGCEEWFHMACVGLDMTDISEDEDYICAACSRETMLAAAAAGMEFAEEDTDDADEGEDNDDDMGTSEIDLARIEGGGVGDDVVVLQTGVVGVEELPAQPTISCPTDAANNSVVTNTVMGTAATATTTATPLTAAGSARNATRHMLTHA